MKRMWKKIYSLVIIVAIVTSFVVLPDVVAEASSQADKLISIAKNEVGTKEDGNDNVKYNNYNGQQWCAWFVTWCAKEAGLSDIIPKFTVCSTGYNDTLPDAGGVKHKSQTRGGSYTPKKGDIIFFWKVSSSDYYGIHHVGIVYDVDDTKVYYYDGNNVSTTPHCVAESEKMLSDYRIYGYITPDYEDIAYIKSAKGISHSEITVTWNEIDDATNYKVLRRKAGTGNEYVTAKSSTTDTSFTDTGLEKNQRYYYKVVAYDGSTELGTSDAVGAYTKFDPPTIKAESTSKLSLSWDTVSYAESYTVRRRVEGGEYDDVKTVTETTYADSGLTAGTKYYYWIQANCNVNGEEITAKSTSSSQYTLPNAPTITSIDDTSKTEITIKWSTVDSATAYRVARRKASDADYVTVKSSTVETTFTDNNLEVGERYYYRVYAINSGGESSNSETVGGYTKFDQPSVSAISSTQLNLSWSNISYAESFTVRRRKYDGEYADVETVTEKTYIDSGLESGTKYYYWIQANCNVEGTKYIAKSTSKGQFTKLQAPLYTVSGQTVNLSWNAAKGDLSYTYKILRKEATATSYTTVTTTSSTAYTDSGLKADTTYYYYIDVLENGNWCANSDGITVTTPKVKDSVAPTISDVKVTDVSGEKFTFNCRLTDNVGVIRVWIAVCDSNGNWYQYGLNATDGDFSHTVYTKDLAGEGKYNMHLYAYDEANNETKVEVNDISAVNLYHLDVNGFVDGQEITDLTGYVTFDLYVDGVLIGDDISDHCELYSFGSNYEITDIKPVAGFVYKGISENSKELIGTIEMLSVIELVLETEKILDYTIKSLEGVVLEGSFYAEAEITKNTDRDAVDTIVIAVYKDGVLIDIIYMRSKFANGQTVVFGGYLEGVEGATLKAFVWDGMTSMNTLSNVIEK